MRSSEQEQNSRWPEQRPSSGGDECSWTHTSMGEHTARKGATVSSSAACRSRWIMVRGGSGRAKQHTPGKQGDRGGERTSSPPMTTMVPCSYHMDGIELRPVPESKIGRCTGQPKIGLGRGSGDGRARVPFAGAEGETECRLVDNPVVHRLMHLARPLQHPPIAPVEPAQRPRGICAQKHAGTSSRATMHRDDAGRGNRAYITLSQPARPVASSPVAGPAVRWAAPTDFQEGRWPPCVLSAGTFWGQKSVAKCENC